MAGLRMNFTGKREGDCPTHGKFMGPTSAEKRNPQCPQCKEVKAEEEAARERKVFLERLILALRESPNLSEELKRILTG
jgi:hypothetical protein